MIQTIVHFLTSITGMVILSGISATCLLAYAIYKDVINDGLSRDKEIHNIAHRKSMPYALAGSLLMAISFALLILLTPVWYVSVVWGLVVFVALSLAYESVKLYIYSITGC